MQLGDVTTTTVPKLTMVSPPSSDGDLSTRTFIPHRCHDAIGVLGAVSVATAALLPGPPAAAVAARRGAATTGDHAASTPRARSTAAVEVDDGASVPVVGGPASCAPPAS